MLVNLSWVPALVSLGLNYPLLLTLLVSPLQASPSPTVPGPPSRLWASSHSYPLSSPSTPGALFLLLSSCALYLPTESFIFTHSLPHSFIHPFLFFFFGLLPYH